MSKSGQRIKEAREAKGWSQEDLASRAKVSQQTIAKIESGTTTRSRFFPALARILNVPLEEIDGAYAIEVSPLPERRSLPVHMTIPGREFGRQKELLYVEDPAYHVHRPEPLFDLPGFGLVCGDNSIEPIAKTGDLLLCGKYHKKVVDGPCVLIGKRVEELSGMRPVLVRASMLDFEMELGEMYLLERHTPPGVDAVPQSEWEWTYKIYGVHFQR